MKSIAFVLLGISVVGTLYGMGNNESWIQGKGKQMDFFLDRNDIIIIDHNEDTDNYTIKIINDDKFNWVIRQIGISSRRRQAYPKLLFHIGERVIVAGGHSINWSGPYYIVGTEYVYTPEALTGELRKIFNYDMGNNNEIYLVNVERQWRR